MDYALRIVVEKVAISSQEVIMRDTITSYALQCPTSYSQKIQTRCSTNSYASTMSPVLA